MTRPNALIGCAIAAGVVFVAAFVALSLGGSSQRPGLVLMSGLCLLVSAILLQLALSRVRVERLLPWWLRLGLPAVVMVAGLVAAAVWASATSTRTIGGWGLAGVCAFYLGAGQVLAEWRASRRWALWRGAVICAVCGTAFLVGVLL